MCISREIKHFSFTIRSKCHYHLTLQCSQKTQADNIIMLCSLILASKESTRTRTHTSTLPQNLEAPATSLPAKTNFVQSI